MKRIFPLKYILIVAIFAFTSISISQPALAAFQGSSNRIIVALNDNGSFFRLTSKGWLDTENPCPGDGPYQLKVVEHPSYPESLLIYAFDNTGHVYAFSDSFWSAPMLLHDLPQTGCFSDIYEVNESGLRVILIDSEGNISITSAHARGLSFPAFTLVDVQNMVALYDSVTTTLAPFILGANGQIYMFKDNEWQTLVDSTITAPTIIDFDTFIHPKTRDVFLMAIDNEGLIYDYFSGSFALSTLSFCPGEPPFNLEIVFTQNDLFDILCLDSSGNLFIANSGFTWNQVASAFSQ